MVDRDDIRASSPASGNAQSSDVDRLREALEHSEERYRAIVEQSLIGIMITQATAPRFVFVNDAFSGITGYRSEELLALTAEQVMGLIHPDDHEQAMAPYLSLLEGPSQKILPRRTLQSKAT